MSKLTLIALAILAYALAVDAGRSPTEEHERQHVGPFQHQILNDMFKAMLTLYKIMVDIFRRNIQNEDGFKVAVRHVLAPIVSFARDVLYDAAGAKVSW